MTRKDIDVLKEAQLILGAECKYTKQSAEQLTKPVTQLQTANNAINALLAHYLDEGIDIKEHMLSHPFYNNNIANDIIIGIFKKDKKYTADIVQQHHGEYTLTITKHGFDEGVYENYITQEEAEHDLKHFREAGYKIIVN